MKNTTSRVLELTIISGESLSLAENRPIKNNTTYVIIKYSSNDQIATTKAIGNGSYQIWSQKFIIHMPMHATFFTLEVRSGDHVVGSVRVPVSDFTLWYFPSDYLHFLSYRLRDRYGERNGIINLSVKVKSPGNLISAAGAGGFMGVTTAATGWKYDGGVSQGVAIGVPFRC